ncbi:hypothetical protein QAD02_009640 [Eretmocerus hayati]|uniref:Uncharacterized protein n=1 Tax=Eretmocerus hayati TaxID=131215 RepID=A0ACC2NC99_9HYME|nr:hypothetical protein QAD02_009640 [Eretmocerus hayati]
MDSETFLEPWLGKEPNTRLEDSHSENELNKETGSHPLGSNPPIFLEAFQAKGDGKFSDYLLTAIRLRDPRRMLMRRNRKPYRSRFQNRLETVYEENHSFAYLFPQQ